MVRTTLICATLIALAAAPALAASGSATYAYDALGRLISITYSDGKTIAFTYDAVGNRTSRVVTVP